MINTTFIIFASMALSPLTLALAQSTGPALPNPQIQTAFEGTAIVKTTTVRDNMTEKDLSTHVITIESDAAIPLFNSLTSVPKKIIPASNIQQETRIGRNVQCSSRIMLANVKPKQTITCELTLTEGEYLDLSLTQIPEEQNGPLLPVRSTPVTAKVQARHDGIHVTISGVLPKYRGANEIFNTLSAEIDDSQSTTENVYLVKTKNMIKCVRESVRSKTTASCTTIFKDGVALIASAK